jgi:hypothetical protein
VLSWVGIALGVTAFLAGLTGTWSPCGFSMVDSLGRGTREGRRAVTLAACAAFAGGRPAAVAAFGVAVTGALAELRGVRIRPQIRRQVPEPWRRVLPLPLAAALYGALLGVGFATFVLTLAVVALAAISLALGDPVLGLAVGAAFGAGRALPVVVLAPASRTASGARALELMAEGLALAAAAVALGTGPAWGSRQVAGPASDPSVSGDVIAFEDEDGVAVVRSRGSELRLPGSDPAVGGPYVAWRRGDLVTVVDRETRRTVNLTIAGVDALALSRRWVAWRSRSARGDRVGAARLPAGRPLRRVKSISGLGRLGRPALGGDRLAYSVAGRRGSRIVIVNLRTRRRRTAVRSRSRQLLNPSLRGSRLLYVSIGRCGQQLRLRRRGHERVLMRGRPLARTDAGFDRGHTSQGSGYGPCARRFRPTPTMLWTTALGERSAYVTLLRPRAERGGARIVRVGR